MAWEVATRVATRVEVIQGVAIPGKPLSAAEPS